MVILGLGMDIVEIARIRSVIDRRGDRFVHRILSSNELTLWKNHQQPVRFIAKRFAAKEAAVKAFNIGIRNGLAFDQFEIANDKFGKPKLSLHGKALKLSEKMGVSYVHVTLADEYHYACATVIIER